MQLVSGGPVLTLPNTPDPLDPYDEYGRTATSCVGLLSGNDQPLPDNNIGEYQDGLLNGEVWNSGSADGQLSPNNTLFDPFYLNGIDNDLDNDGFNDDLVFIEPSDLQKLDPDGEAEDPGWVFLGKQEGGDFDYSVAGKNLEDDEGDSISIDIGDVLTVNFSCSYTEDSVVMQVSITHDKCEDGMWDISPVENIATLLEPVFGNGFFDHLAIIFKGGPEFAVYDFDFNMINAELGNNLDLTVPYNLSGTFNMEATFGNTAISHVSLWARDPAGEDVTISEPSVRLLFALGLLMIFMRFKKQHGIL